MKAETELEKKMKEVVQRKKSEVLVAKIQQDHFLVLRVAVLVSRHLRGDLNPLQFFCKGKNLETAELVHEFLRQKNNLPNTLSREKKMKEASRRVLIKKGLI